MEPIEQHLDYARDLCQQGRLEEGKEIYLRLYEIDSNNFRVLANLGALELTIKNYEMSAQYLQKATQLNPTQPVIHYNLGRALHELKRYNDAANHYIAAIKLHPDFTEAYLNYGLTLASQASYQLAIEQYNKAIELNPRYAEAYSNRGVALSAIDKDEEALSSYQNAILINPNNFEVYNNLGAVLCKLKRYEDALANFDKVIQLAPNYAQAYSNRGLTFNALGYYENAVSDYKKTIELDPNSSAERYNNLGAAFYQLRKYYDAIANYDKAIALKADYAEAYSNRGLSFNYLRQYENSLADYEKALQLKPDYALNYNNLGLTLYRLGRYEEALEAYDKAIILEPEQALAYWNKSFIKLLMGQYEEGWELYERRWQKKGFEENRHSNIPAWTGLESLEGKSLLVWSEQGLGDVIQFSRYALMAKSRGAKVILEVPQSLTSLISSIDQDIIVIEEVQSLIPHADFQIPMMSLPHAFRTTVETIPSNIPYLHTDADKVAYWKNKLGNKNQLRVGLVWTGSTLHKNDANRSIPLTKILSITKLPIELHSLQIHYTDSDIDLLKSASEINQHQSELKSFSDTAALIANMDLIISVDTSVAHLAGALGKPTWIILPHSPDFRWMLDTNGSPWYPTAKLFRQPQMDDWSSVIYQIQNELQHLTR